MKIRIAIVDSQVLFREGLIALFKELEGLEVVMEAHSARDFLEKLDSQPENTPDVVLIDLATIRKEGNSISQYLCENHPGVKVIVINVPDNPIPISRLVSIRAHFYFLRNSYVQEIAETIYSLKKDEDACIDASILMEESMEHSVNSHNLSQRELEVIKLISEEYTSKQISGKLFISPKTVERHRENIQKKIGSLSAVGVIMYAVRNNLID